MMSQITNRRRAHECPRRTVYNSRNPEMKFPPSRVHWLLCICFLIGGTSFAAEWQPLVAQLAEKIAATTGPGVISLEVNTRSSISAAETEDIHRQLTVLLANSGVRVWQPDQAAANVTVTLSENVQDYVWVAEVQQAATEKKVILVSASRPVIIANAQNALPLIIRELPLVSRPEPILDVAVLTGSPQRILVLGRNDVALEEFQNGRWVTVQSLSITSPNALPRDARGRIVVAKDHLFEVYLPGLICRSTNSSPLQMNCSPSEDPWPMAASGLSAFFSPSRNFFTGALVPGIGKQKSAPPFYSAAAIPRANYTRWIFTGLDGLVHLLDGINQQVLGRVHWGSDVAAVHEACRPGWQILADSPGTEQSDWIQAYEFSDREPAAVSEKLALNGAVSAIWPTGDAAGAIAVYQSSSTGNYEAVQLNLDCIR